MVIPGVTDLNINRHELTLMHSSRLSPGLPLVHDCFPLADPPMATSPVAVVWWVFFLLS